MIDPSRIHPRAYDVDHRPLTYDELATGEIWGDDRRKIARTVVGERVVSTSFLVIAHGFRNGLPVLYETLVLGLPNFDDQYTRRYCTREKAVLGHEEVVGMVRLLDDIDIPES